jgi:hypothetical protein
LAAVEEQYDTLMEYIGKASAKQKRDLDLEQSALLIFVVSQVLMRTKTPLLNTFDQLKPLLLSLSKEECLTRFM